ncbi:MAG: 30S ribosomal protein S8e [archaeon]|nr:30S ribosomal protein S8e [archaeon]
MTQWHTKSKKKPSGGFRNAINRTGKRLYFRGNDPTNTIASKTEQKKKVRVRGRTHKHRMQKASHALITDQKAKKTFKAEILSEVANEANKQFVRRNVLTKGGVIKATHSGKEIFAKITSRPGQTGIVQAILVDAPVLKEDLEAKEVKKTRTGKQKTNAKPIKAPKQTESPRVPVSIKAEA